MENFKNELKEQNWWFTAKAHINLREPKGTKPTPLYLVFKLGGKQHKIPMGVKCIPSQWDKKNGKAMISASLSDIENRNNFVCNAKISETMLAYSRLIDYLCSHLDELNNPSNAISSVFGMKKKKVTKEKLSATLSTALRKRNMANSSYEIFNGVLKEFIEWVDVNHKDATIDDLTPQMLKEYMEYLFNKKVTHKITGEKVKAENNTVVNKLNNICTIVGYLENDALFSALRKVTKGIETFNQAENQIYVDNDEIERIYALELEGEEEIARDLFIFQLSSGQRYSDITKLCGTNLKDSVNGDMVSIKQQKTKAKVSFPIDDKAKSILIKYGYVLPKMTNKKVNGHLKEIGKKAKMVEMIDNEELRGNEVYPYQAEKYKLLTTHCSRRAFITNALKDNVDTSVIKKISGHKTDSAFQRYNRMSGEDAVETLLKVRNGKNTENVSGNAGNLSEITGNPQGEQSTQNEIEETRRVLFFLGADAMEVYQDDNIERLRRLIYGKELEIEKRCGVGFESLKEIFNSDRPFIEKLKYVKELLNI